MSCFGYAPPPAWTSAAADLVLPRARADLVLEPLDDEALLVAPAGAIHRLNATALFVWRHCDGRTALHTLADRLTRQFEVDFATARRHVEETLALFAELGLLAAEPLA
jgi:hypothetical protein